VIYRFLSESLVEISDSADATRFGRLGGPMSSNVDFRAVDRLPMPDFDKPQARFWFTEAGWRRFGIAWVKDHERAGRTVRVIRQKNPKRSDVFYRDEWQVALLAARRSSFRRGQQSPQW